MDKKFSPSYSSSQITYAEAVEFSRFRFHIPDRNRLHLCCNRPMSDSDVWYPVRSSADSVDRYLLQVVRRKYIAVQSSV